MFNYALINIKLRIKTNKFFRLFFFNFSFYFIALICTHFSSSIQISYCRSRILNTSLYFFIFAHVSEKSSRVTSRQVLLAKSVVFDFRCTLKARRKCIYVKKRTEKNYKIRNEVLSTFIIRQNDK